VVAGYPVWRFKRSDWIGALCCVIGWLVGLSVFVEDTEWNGCDVVSHSADSNLIFEHDV